MVFPLISDFSHAPVWVPPADIPEGPFAVLTQERSQEDRLTALAVNYGPRLLVPEVWSRLLPQAGVLISSAISFSGRTDRRLTPKMMTVTSAKTRISTRMNVYRVGSKTM